MIADNGDLDRVEPPYLDHLVDPVLDRNQFLSAERTVGGLKGNIVMFLADETLVVKTTLTIKLRTRNRLQALTTLPRLRAISEGLCSFRSAIALISPSGLGSRRPVSIRLFRSRGTASGES